MQQEMSARLDCERSSQEYGFSSVHSVADQPRPYMSSGELYGNSVPMGMYINSNMYQGNYGILSDQGKGKGKAKEVDFEAAFAQAAASFAPARAETSRIAEVDDNVTDVEQAMKNTTLEDDTKVDDRAEFKQ
jgi:peroxin-5